MAWLAPCSFQKKAMPIHSMRMENSMEAKRMKMSLTLPSMILAIVPRGRLCVLYFESALLPTSLLVPALPIVTGVIVFVHGGEHLD